MKEFFFICIDKEEVRLLGNNEESFVCRRFEKRKELWNNYFLEIGKLNIFGKYVRFLIICFGFIFDV